MCHFMRILGIITPLHTTQLNVFLFLYLANLDTTKGEDLNKPPTDTVRYSDKSQLIN